MNLAAQFTNNQKNITTNNFNLYLKKNEKLT
jgi:hypothetical protein